MALFMGNRLFFDNDFKQSLRVSFIVQARFASINPLTLLTGKLFLSIFNPQMAASLGGFSTLMQYSLLNSAILSILELLRLLTENLIPSREIKVLSPFVVLALELISAPIIGGYYLNVPIIALLTTIAIGRALCNEFDFISPITAAVSPF
jgi:hypothetical protein